MHWIQIPQSFTLFSSFQELIDINNLLFLELLTSDDNVPCSMNRAREYNS